MDFGNDKGRKDGWVTQEAKFKLGKSCIFALSWMSKVVIG